MKQWDKLMKETNDNDQIVAKILKDMPATPSRSNIVFVENEVDVIENGKVQFGPDGKTPMKRIDKKAVFLKGTTLGEVMIYLIDDDRFVKATTNNPNSSRSHTLIFVKFYKRNENSEPFGLPLRLVVGDFAGVENVFDCKDPLIIKNFVNVKRDDGSGRPFYSEEIVNRQDSVDGGGMYGGKDVVATTECKQYVGLAEDMYVFGDGVSSSPDTKVDLGLPFAPNKRRRYLTDNARDQALKDARLKPTDMKDEENGDDDMYLGYTNRYDEMIRIVINGLASLEPDVNGSPFKNSLTRKYIDTLLELDIAGVTAKFAENKYDEFKIKDTVAISILERFNNIFKSLVSEGSKKSLLEYFKKVYPDVDDKNISTIKKFVYEKELKVKREDLNKDSAELESLIGLIVKQPGDILIDTWKAASTLKDDELVKLGADISVHLGKIKAITNDKYKLEITLPTFGSGNIN
ncbi:MAG: hypothetical protein EB127_25225, partial [Alphaproteobacteria bacterium]|nr:hypothetical protein [Alphaproteobacteria bacterium]